MADYKEWSIEGLKGRDFATVTAYSGSRLKGRIMKLKDRDEVEIIAENEDGSIMAHVPANWVKITPPRNLTDEQREALAKRIMDMREEYTVLKDTDGKIGFNEIDEEFI